MESWYDYLDKISKERELLIDDLIESAGMMLLKNKVLLVETNSRNAQYESQSRLLDSLQLQRYYHRPIQLKYYTNDNTGHRDIGFLLEFVDPIIRDAFIAKEKEYKTRILN
ncbi:MAG: hypothetical protein ACMXYL_04360 [Candidatus Woesearchaeota archaeon]